MIRTVAYATRFIVLLAASLQTWSVGSKAVAQRNIVRSGHPRSLIYRYAAPPNVRDPLNDLYQSPAFAPSYRPSPPLPNLGQDDYDLSLKPRSGHEKVPDTKPYTMTLRALKKQKKKKQKTTEKVRLKSTPSSKSSKLLEEDSNIMLITNHDGQDVTITPEAAIGSMLASESPEDDANDLSTHQQSQDVAVMPEASAGLTTNENILGEGTSIIEPPGVTFQYKDDGSMHYVSGADDIRSNIPDTSDVTITYDEDGNIDTLEGIEEIPVTQSTQQAASDTSMATEEEGTVYKEISDEAVIIDKRPSGAVIGRLSTLVLAIAAYAILFFVVLELVIWF